MDRKQIEEQAEQFWREHLRKCDGLGDHTHPQILAKFAIEVGKEQAAEIERLRAALKSIHGYLSDEHVTSNTHRLGGLGAHCLKRATATAEAALGGSDD